MKTKKIGIITFYAPLNCGAFLQAYALVTYLNTLPGVSAQILHYHTKKQEQLSGIFLPGSSPSALAKNLYSAVFYGKLKERRDEFLSMQERYLHLSKELATYEDFKEACLEYDVLISGSDQIWNPTLNGFSDGGQEPFFLKDCCAKKISYASSLGPVDSVAVRKGLRAFLPALKEYDAISVRETMAKTLLEELLDRPVTVVPDPVFLLSQKDYLPLLDHHLAKEQDYILLYSVNYPDTILKATQTLSKKTGLPVYVPYCASRSLHCIPYGFSILYNAGPGCFLDFVKHATYVLTDSFHGCAFSVLFDKNFFYCPHFTDTGIFMDARMQTLFHTVGASDRIVSDLTLLSSSEYLKQPDFVKNSTLDKEIAAAKKWLQQAIDHSI